jgi:hypothetical protein
LLVFVVSSATKTWTPAVPPQPHGDCDNDESNSPNWNCNMD